MATHNTSLPPVVLVTGASTGIGRACALELDRLGWRVLAGVRSEAAADDLRHFGSDRLRPILLDVTDAAGIAAAAEVAREWVATAGLAGLVNNAGIVVAGPLELIPLDELRRQFEVNVVGQIAVTQALLPLLRAAPGRIVNISSLSGFLAAPYLGPYAASKFALEALSDSLRVELRRFGIRVSLVEPGNVATPIWEKSLAAADRLVERMPHGATDLYAADLDVVRTLTRQSPSTAMPVERVVRAVVHALTARRPRARYPVGFAAKLAAHVLRHLPAWLRDPLVIRAMGLK